MKIKSTCVCGKEIDIEEVSKDMETFKCPYCKTEYLLKIVLAEKEENPAIKPMFIGASFIAVIGLFACLISMIFGR